MRKRYRVLIIAAFVAALIVPLGFALSLESSSTAAPSAPVAADVVAASNVMTAPALIRDGSAAQAFMYPVSDTAKLFFIGSALFALAAAVRRSK